MGSVNAIAKEDWPAILPGGVHTLTLEHLGELVVEALPYDQQRARLFNNLGNWLEALSRNRLGGKIWCCGSFMTTKPKPNDIDVVLWGPRSPCALSDDLSNLLDKHQAMMSFGLDLHVESFHPDLVLFREAYHLGFHGFANDRRTPRGIAEIILE